MKKQAVARILSALLVVCVMFLTACGTVNNANDNGVLNPGSDGNNPVGMNPSDNSNKDQASTDSNKPTGDYREGVVLVKYSGEMNDTVLSQLDVASAEPLYTGSSWYSLALNDTSKTVETVSYLRELGCFDKVDYDYIMGTTDKPEQNPNYKDQVNLGLSNIPNGWTHNGKAPGGSPDVVVAVIDTGVDYNHLDLRNNIWINTAEIPDNGKDDDRNGYIDDVYGWDCVGNDNDPMDDNGHGTHVAGIIAAENNKVGGIGVAYNCKVMVLKAGNSSGYFNNSDIAEAIQYAYMNGASVINMSFGGSFISIAVEEALENAYNTCVLVAAAGNDGACNNLDCTTCGVVKVSYPAALPYVIGVMSTDKNGSGESYFSNYDHYPYDSIEYEVFAVGEGVGSTWPSNEYACLNGTSMAAPTVAGIAALLRSTYTDREVYSTKFIQSQIVNTGDLCLDGAHTVADVQNALTKLPKPAVNLYGYTIDDSVSISNKNNGNGVIDAGETVRLYISLHNRGGVASNVNVSIDTDRGMGMTDPYFTFVNPTMQLSDIGTYSVRESGDKYFEIVVDANCPNDYLVNFNIRFTYTNGLDTDDKTVYEDDGRQQAQFNVSSGYLLPRVIEEDTVFTKDRRYIVGENVTIPAGVTVTFEEGCHIQFYDDREYYNSPSITVYGTLNVAGSKDHMVVIAPNERNATFICNINVEYGGSAFIDYADCVNLQVVDLNYYGYDYNILNKSGISNSYLKSSTDYSGRSDVYENSTVHICQTQLCVAYITGSYINTSYSYIKAGEITSNFIVMEGDESYISAEKMRWDDTLEKDVYEGKFINNIVYTSVNEKSPTSSSDRKLLCWGADEIRNNIFLTSDNSNSKTFLKIEYNGHKAPVFSNNSFDEYFYTYADQIISGYFDANGTPTIDLSGSCSDVSALYPHIVKVEIFNADGEQITIIGKEKITVRVTFNKAMDTTKDVSAFFGTIAPYADYKIEGAFVSETVWEGTYSLKAYIENGLQFMQVKGACAADDATKTVRGENQMYVFNIDTNTAMAMSLVANATNAGIELTFAQDDYDTLLGYNIYRADSKDGNYVKLNPTILLPSESKFLDDNAESSKTYWYTYTVVLTDFTESNPAGKVCCTAADTIAPSVYHTPVNQGYAGNNLVISCTASDNVAISTVTLYYRAVGATEWKSLTMAKQSDKYSAAIFGSELTLNGIEYYIVADDGRNTINKGSAETPYSVVVKDASAISRKGDVDGDGVVTTKDALMLMQCINGDLILSDDEFRRADLNGDGILNSSEALRILQYINGKVNTLEM